MHLEWKQQMTRVTLIKNDSVFVDWLTINCQLVHWYYIVTEVALGVIRNWDVHLWSGSCTLYTAADTFVYASRQGHIKFASRHFSVSMSRTLWTHLTPHVGLLLCVCTCLQAGSHQILTQGISWCPWHCGHIWPCEYASPFDRSRWISPHAYASDLCILPTSLCLLPWMSCPPH